MPFIGPYEICIILFPNSVQFFPILNILKFPFFATYHNFTVKECAARCFPLFFEHKWPLYLYTFFHSTTTAPYVIGRSADFASFSGSCFNLLELFERWVGVLVKWQHMISCISLHEGSSTDQDLLSGVVLVFDLFAQFSFRNLQVLPHITAVLEEGQVAIFDPDQLGEKAQQMGYTYITLFPLFLFLALCLNDCFNDKWASPQQEMHKLLLGLASCERVIALIRAVWSVMLALRGLFSSMLYQVLSPSMSLVFNLKGSHFFVSIIC